MKGVIFDLDGVICSTDDYHYAAWKRAADELGIYFDKQINNRLRGVSRAESLEIILERYDGVLSAERKAEVLAYKNDLYRKYLNNMSPKDLDKSVMDVLQWLRNRGIKLAIGSSSKNAGFILEHLLIGDFFDAVCDGNDIIASKPDPEVFLKAAQKISLAPADCLVVEDSTAGVAAAKAGGFMCAAIGDARNHVMADYRLDSLSELILLQDVWL